MTAQFNEDGNIEVYPGPRGFSVNGVELSEDGSVAYFTTDEPGRLNGVPLPRGPKGRAGDYGDPGEARLRVDTTVGYRVFLWDTFTAGENMVYGATGVRDLGDGRLVARTGNTVEVEGTIEDLPYGFTPAQPQPGTVHKVYLTDDEWPEALPGTEHTAPPTMRGLEGYEAATAQGFPGTAEQWMAMVYGVLPVDGTAGQWLTWSEIGPAWAPLPTIGPSPWTTVTLASTWRPETGHIARVRKNNGTVEFAGGIVYTGPTRTAGFWGDEFVRIGTIPSSYAPEYALDTPVTVWRGIAGTAGTPVPGRLSVSNTGVLSVGAFDLSTTSNGLPMLASVTKMALTGVSYAPRTP